MTTQDTTLDGLTRQWKETKQRLKAEQDRLLMIESTIFAQVANTLPDKGTTHLETGMKIVTGLSESWDQELLNDAHRNWPEGRIPFPFYGEWVPDNKAVGYVREHAADLYALLQPALTLKPKKPSFSVKEA